MGESRTAGDVLVSTREAEVLAALGEHLTNAEIGARLFISIRTVESHVSSLLRKFGVSDRRALAGVAATLRVGAATASGSQPRRGSASLPSTLTSFIGRADEQRALVQALAGHRLVTVVGPGGVGKTRLALRVAAEVTDRFADGAWFLDLVPVTDHAMIAPALVNALGLGEHQARSPEDTLASWLAERQVLLVLDNCEHLMDGVVVLLERLLADAPHLTVLATSRARLLVPFEWVFALPGLSVEWTNGQAPDAVELFVGRAAAGGTELGDGDLGRVAAVCQALDGIPLAIELAAARYSSLGLDGLEGGLANRLHLLTGGPRRDDRHRSLRSTLNWSHALLDDREQAVLRRISVFAAPFTAAMAGELLERWPPTVAAGVGAVLAQLADQSLLVPVADAAGTRYRALEIIRQYGAEKLDATGESFEAGARHLAWCLRVADSLAGPRDVEMGEWRARFDSVADELRAAVVWVADQPQLRSQGYALASRVGELSFLRGFMGESQRRYEQAAELAADERARAVALGAAAGAAGTRHFGDDALRLHRAAAEAFERAGDNGGAAMALAVIAEMINRAPGLMSSVPPQDEVVALLRRAWSLAAGDTAAEARTLAAESFNWGERDEATVELAERAITLSRRAGDAIAESAALDQLTAVHLARNEIRAAAVTTRRRIALLEKLPVTSQVGLELSDGYCMAAECAIAAGDLEGGRSLAQALHDLPIHREEAHLATARLIVLTALTGEWDETVALAERFREGWDRAGRPRAGNLSRGAYAAAAVHGLRGNDDERATWLRIVDRLATPGRPPSTMHFGEFFDALLLLHRGENAAALRELAAPPETFQAWHNGLWRPWYAALWAEAAVLTDHPDAPTRIERARHMTLDNAVADAIVDRAAALLRRDEGGLAAAAASLDSTGSRYQFARTLIMAGSARRAEGDAILAAIGATPMAWPG